MRLAHACRTLLWPLLGGAGCHREGLAWQRRSSQTPRQYATACQRQGTLPPCSLPLRLTQLAFPCPQAWTQPLKTPSLQLHPSQRPEEAAGQPEARSKQARHQNRRRLSLHGCWPSLGQPQLPRKRARLTGSHPAHRPASRPGAGALAAPLSSTQPQQRRHLSWASRLGQGHPGSQRQLLSRPNRSLHSHAVMLSTSPILPHRWRH